LPTLRRAIRARYRLLPYLYHLSLASSQQGEPLARPLVYDFSHDAHVRTTLDRSFHDAEEVRIGPDCDWMLGSGLLVAPVTRAGATSRQVYLPTQQPAAANQAAWFSWTTDSWYPGGTVATVPSSCNDALAPTLQRRGHGIPLLATLPARSSADLAAMAEGGGRCILMSLPLASEEAPAECVASWLEDDGESLAQVATTWKVTVRLEASVASGRITGEATASASAGSKAFTLPFSRCLVVLPASETRPVEGLQRLPEDELRRLQSALHSEGWPCAGRVYSLPLALAPDAP
jgi:alpha-glucosidase